MKTEKIENPRENLKKDLLLQNGYQYIWGQEISRVYLDRVEDSDFDIDQIIEARIFGKDGTIGQEIHVYEEDDSLAAIRTVRESADHEFTIERHQILRPRFGQSLTICDFIEYDEDEEAYIAGSMFCDCELGR